MEIGKAAKAILLGRECRNCRHAYIVVPMKNGKTARQYVFGFNVDRSKIVDDDLYCGLYSDMAASLGKLPKRTVRMHRQQLTEAQMEPRKIPPERTCVFWDEIK
jgi:hypothetical protein